jgi:hypothetical protein
MRRKPTTANQKRLERVRSIVGEMVGSEEATA